MRQKIHYENFSLGFNRLSIIGVNNELSSTYRKQGTMISFNGEIFNYKELAKLN